MPLSIDKHYQHVAGRDQQIVATRVVLGFLVATIAGRDQLVANILVATTATFNSAMKHIKFDKMHEIIPTSEQSVVFSVFANNSHTPGTF